MIYQRTLVLFGKYSLTVLPFFLKFFIKNTAGVYVNNDLKMMSNWAFWCKMQFNPNPNKQAQELRFSIKYGKQNSLDDIFNKSEVVSYFPQKTSRSSTRQTCQFQSTNPK